MSTHVDWRTEIDSAVEHLPDRPPAVYVAAGRRSLRRRRLVVGVAGLTAVVLSVSVGFAATSGGSAPRSDAPVASDPAVPDSEVTTPRPAGEPWAKGEAPARVSPGTGLEIRDGAVVHERRDNVYPGKDTQSVALDLTFEDERWWVLLEWDEGGAATAQSRAADTADSFDEFVSENIEGGGMFSAPQSELDEKFPQAGLVNYTTNRLVVRKGAEIVRRVDNPMGLESPKSSVGLVVEHAGTTTWMLLETGPRGGGGSYEDEVDSGWPTFDLWLADSVALQKGQPGLRLATLAEDGTLSPGEDGVQILDQLPNPAIPEYVDESATASGVAMLRWRGETWFVLAVRYDDQDAITTVAASKAPGADDIESFLDFMRDHVDEGGMR